MRTRVEHPRRSTNEGENRMAALLRQAIDVVDDLVFAREQIAYAQDDYGVHANPNAPLALRFALWVLSRLMRARDGQAPRWDRRPGEPHDRWIGA
jgi:hypothetical protein